MEEERLRHDALFADKRAVLKTLRKIAKLICPAPGRHGKKVRKGFRARADLEFTMKDISETTTESERKEMSESHHGRATFMRKTEDLERLAKERQIFKALHRVMPLLRGGVIPASEPFNENTDVDLEWESGDDLEENVLGRDITVLMRETREMVRDRTKTIEFTSVFVNLRRTINEYIKSKGEPTQIFVTYPSLIHDAIERIHAIASQPDMSFGTRASALNRLRNIGNLICKPEDYRGQYIREPCHRSGKLESAMKDIVQAMTEAERKRMCERRCDHTTYLERLQTMHERLGPGGSFLELPKVIKLLSDDTTLDAWEETEDADQRAVAGQNKTFDRHVVKLKKVLEKQFEDGQPYLAEDTENAYFGGIKMICEQAAGPKQSIGTKRSALINLCDLDETAGFGCGVLRDGIYSNGTLERTMQDVLKDLSRAERKRMCKFDCGNGVSVLETSQAFDKRTKRTPVPYCHDPIFKDFDKVVMDMLCGWDVQCVEKRTR